MLKLILYTAVLTLFITTGAEAQVSISNVSSSGITETSAVIRWTTNQRSNSTILYGVIQTNLNLQFSDSRFSKSHSFTISNLIPNTLYYYSVSSSTNSRTGASSIRSFTTLGAADTTPPLAQITAGPSGSVTEISATLSFSATDSQSGISRIECRLDSAVFFACPGISISYSSLSLGGHTFQVRAFDVAGNVSITVSRSWTVVSPQQNITVAWDANTETNLVGYRVYYGATSGSYNQVQGQGINVGLNTTAAFGGFVSGQRVYFTVTAFDSNGLESAYASEIAHTVP